MKFLVVLAVAIACVSADVSHLDSQAPIVKSEFDSSSDGDFQFGYETGNGIIHNAGGVIRDKNSENPILEVKGGFKYTAPDGTPIELSYIANEYGFNPVGSHLPVPPPIPEYITRALAYIATHTPQAEKAATTGNVGRGGRTISGSSGYIEYETVTEKAATTGNVGRGGRTISGSSGSIEYETVTEIITKPVKKIITQPVTEIITKLPADEVFKYY